MGSIVLINPPPPEREPIVGDIQFPEPTDGPVDEPTDIIPEPPVAPEVQMTTPLNVVHVFDQGVQLPSHNDAVDGNRFSSGPISTGAFSTDRPPSSAPSISTRELPKLGNVPIHSAKLGVVLDISGSGHAHLHRPLREIEAGFQNSFVILYTGCGMKGDARRRDYDFKRGNAVKLEQMKDPKAPAENVGQVLDQASRKNAELQNSISEVLGRKNIYVTDWSCDKKMVIFGAHFALQKLSREGVDTIYWFADFQDVIDAKILEDLTKDLKRRGIKVFCHNFAGKFPSPEREAAIRRLAEETGGQCILTVPGK